MAVTSSLSFMAVACPVPAWIPPEDAMLAGMEVVTGPT